MVINPELECANEIGRVLSHPAAVDVEPFAKGRVELVGLKVLEGMPLAGMKLKEISAKICSTILIGAALRGDEAIIPNGDFQIEENDMIYVIGRPPDVHDFCSRVGLHSNKVRHAMIVGGQDSILSGSIS